MLAGPLLTTVAAGSAPRILCIGIQRGGFDAPLAGGEHRAAGDFATVVYKDFCKHYSEFPLILSINSIFPDRSIIINVLIIWHEEQLLPSSRMVLWHADLNSIFRIFPIATSALSHQYSSSSTPKYFSNRLANCIGFTFCELIFLRIEFN